MPVRPPRNLSLERLEAADRRVRRRVAVLRGRLEAAGIPAALVEGSAIAAELRPPGESRRRRAIRAAIEIARADLRAAERCLRDQGFEAARAAPTIELMRLAHRSGRGAVHVVFDDAADEADDRRPHPGSEEAAMQRAARLNRHRLEAACTMLRRWRRETWLGWLEESLEIGLVAV
jgi:hypothetical protein